MTAITWHSPRIAPPLDPLGTGSVRLMCRDAAGVIWSPCRLACDGKYYGPGAIVENVAAWAIMPITAARRIQKDGG